MKATGKIEIEKGLILANPTAEIINISYSQKTNKILVEVYFSEGGANYKHSRTFEFENETGKDLCFNDVLELVKKDPILSQFK